ncbi:MAG: HAMP domain-containing protein [Gammaproteobacteria bacterium]|nr:HAMP domain-containing protein [Gammaproteobacteria bacterium]
MKTSSSERRRLGLRGKLILAIFAAGSIPIAVGLWVAYDRGNSQLQAVIGDSFKALAMNSASKVDAEIQRVITINRTLAAEAAADPGLRNALLHTGRSPAEAIQVDWPALDSEDQPDWILRASQVTGAASGLLADGPPSPTGVGRVAAVRISGLSLQGEQQRFLFRISTRIQDADSGTLMGWLHRDYDVKNLLDPLVYPVRFGDTGHVMIIDKLGAIVSCPLLRTGSRISDQALVGRVADDNEGWISAHNDGHGSQKFSIIGHAPLRSVNEILEPGAGWYMFVWQDSSEIFAPTRSLLTGVELAGLLAIGLLGILGLYASSRIVKPIRKLRQAAAHIAGGDLNRSPDIDTGDEIEDLAHEFDDMRVQLRQFISTLEDKVDERTRELEDTQAEKDRIVEHLIQAEKMAAMGTMASGIGHEINNPLYAILGRAEAIRDEQDLDRCRAYGKDIIEYAKHIGEIVKDLSGYVRPGTQHDRELVDVNEKLSEAVSMVEQSLLGDGVEFTRSLAPVPGIAAKPEEIRQVFFNVIRNGIQAMGEKGTLDVESRVDDGHVVVMIRDTGPGITKDHQRKIFDPFFTTKGPDEGEGLGLFIVQQIVKKYDGEITVESEHDVGTVFSIRFPVGERNGAL